MGHPQTLDMTSGIEKIMIAADGPPIAARERAAITRELPGQRLSGVPKGSRVT
jgi:hypothetical protein